MNKFKILQDPKNTDWETLLKVIDCVGLWHYTRTIPSEKEYTVITNNSINESEKYQMVISCLRTKTAFIFNQEWKASFYHTEEDGKIKDKFRPVEGQLYSAFSYIETLLDLGLIQLTNN